MRMVAFAAGIVLLLLGAAPAAGSTATVVRPSATQGWFPADMRPGGQARFVPDPTSPFGDGAFELETDGTTNAKAQWLVPVGMPLSQVTALGFWTRYLAGPNYAGPSYQLVVDLDGNDPQVNWTTLVYEPYWNSGTMTVDTSGAWQQWNVASPGAKNWSTRTVNAGGGCSVMAGAGGPPFYTVPQLQSLCPNAVVLYVGVNVGTYNPGYLVRVDGVQVNGTVYDFEPEVTVRVVVTENVVGFEAPGGGWQVTLTGCGVGPITQATNAAGEAVFVALPPADGCTYTVTVAGQAGWTLASATATAAPTEPGSTAEVAFLAIREYDPPCVDPADARCLPDQLPSEPAPPAPIGNQPGATPSPAPPSAPAQPSTPAPSATAGTPVAQPTAPAVLSPTPRPPATGTGPAAGMPGPGGLLFAGVLVLLSGLGLLCARR